MTIEICWGCAEPYIGPGTHRCKRPVQAASTIAWYRTVPAREAAMGERTSRPIEDYEPYKAPGVDCPECQVDTGDSAHFVGCSIGQQRGWDTRRPEPGSQAARCAFSGCEYPPEGAAGGLLYCSIEHAPPELRDTYRKFGCQVPSR